jgi:HNH endonuclease
MWLTIGARAQYETQVSPEDYDFLLGFKWTFARSHKFGELIYARRSVREGSYNRTVLMHRVVLERMGIERPTKRHTADHWDGDSLNNRRDNLRWATPAEQMQNRRGIRSKPVEKPWWDEEIPW